MKTRVIYEGKRISQIVSVVIDKIRIVWKLDEYPDLSWLGEYSDTPNSEFSIKIANKRYFNPSWENYKGESEEVIKKCCQQDFERAEKYNNTEWCMLCCQAEAIVSYPINPVKNEDRRLETFKSCGICGIESDCSDKQFIETIEKDELDDLKEHLKRFNISWPEIA